MSKLQALVWRTEKRRVNDLLPYEKNPRKITEKQMEDLKESLKKFNLAELPAINLDGKICAGHQRIKALQLLGRGEELIEVRTPNRKLTPSEFKQYLLTSNRSGGSWDWEILASDFDIDTLLTSGFDSTDLTHIFDDSLEVTDDNFDEEKELEKIKETDIKTGDVFPSRIFNDLLAVLSAAAAVGGIAPSTSGNLLTSNGSVWQSVANPSLPIAGGTMTGDLKFTDATYDIGKSGATRPRDVFTSRDITAGRHINLAGVFTLTEAATSGRTQFLIQDSSGDGMYLHQGNILNFDYGVNSATEALINYFGYQGGTTQYRNLSIGDGKNGRIVTFTGSDKSARFYGPVGFNGSAVLAKPTISGSRGANAALASLLTALASYGLITDSSS